MKKLITALRMLEQAFSGYGQSPWAYLIRAPVQPVKNDLLCSRRLGIEDSIPLN